MARIRLHAGVWTGSLAFLFGGGSTVLGVNSDNSPLMALGWLSIVAGVGLAVWGIKHDDEHWWVRGKLKLTWPYALMSLGVIAFLTGGLCAWGLPKKSNLAEKMIPVSEAEADSNANVQHYAAQHLENTVIDKKEKSETKIVRVAKLPHVDRDEPNQVQTVAQDTQKTGDIYNITNSGNGMAIGRVDNLAVGKQPFVMSEEVMANVASQLGAPRTIGIFWTGSLRSGTAAKKLNEYLTEKGFVVEDRGSAAMEIPPLEQPIELRGDTLHVDVTK